MDKRVFILAHAEARARAVQAVKDAPDGYSVIVQEKTRTLEQNALMWPILEQFAKKVSVAVDGDAAMLDKETWKDVLTGAFTGEQARMVKYDGALILVGRSTSVMGVKVFADLLTYLLSEMVTRGLELPARQYAEITEYIGRYR